jgi:small-conductance mechanosensitive channel
MALDVLQSIYAPAYHDGIVAALILIAAMALAVLIQKALFRFLERAFRNKNDGIVAALLRRAQAPAGFAFPLLAALIAIPSLTFPPGIDELLIKLSAVASVMAVAWTIIASIGLYSDLVKIRYRVDVEDNLRARQVETRIDILGRTAVTIVVIVSIALAAMAFPSVRALGTTLLASAGAAGIVIGIAARPLFENLIAGVQLALTQPIRIDDVVIVEGEFGHIEQIASTFVVVRIWDQRRMVLPLTYFIEKPFQNWTRTGAALLGTVFLYVDYTLPVDELRAQLPKALEGDPKWDGAVQGVQVTDAKQSTLEIRVLVSARNAADLFDLRCNVREKLIAWIGATYPTALPTERQLYRNAFDAPAPREADPNRTPPPLLGPAIAAASNGQAPETRTTI